MKFRHFLPFAVLCGLLIATLDARPQIWNPWVKGTPVAAGGPPPFASTCATPAPSNNFIARARAANGGAVLGNSPLTSNSFETAYDTMICGLVTDPVWTHVDVLYLFAAPSPSVALLNLVSPSFTATQHGSPAFAAGVGFTGVPASTTVYLDTGFNPVAAAGQFTFSSAHHMIWSFTNLQGTSTAGNVEGQYDGTNISEIVPWSSTNTTVAGIGDTGANQYNASSGSSLGSFLITRTSASAGSEVLYKNGTGGTASGGASTPVNLNFFVLGVNTSGAGSNGAGLQVAAFSAGSSLTQAQVSSSAALTGTGLVPRVCTFLTTIKGAC